MLQCSPIPIISNDGYGAVSKSTKRSYIECFLLECQVHLSSQTHGTDGITDNLQIRLSLGLDIAFWPGIDMYCDWLICCLFWCARGWLLIWRMCGELEVNGPICCVHRLVPVSGAILQPSMVVVVVVISFSIVLLDMG